MKNQSNFNILMKIHQEYIQRNNFDLAEVKKFV